MRNIFYFGCFLFIIIAACKKNSGPSNCKVAAVALVPKGGTPQAVNFTYDDNGKLKYMINGSQSVEYTWVANGYRRFASTGNGWTYRSFIELNADGKPVTKKDSTYNGQNLNATTLYTYEYDGQGQLIKIFKNNSPQPEDIFTWSNGNLVKYQSGNVIYIMDHYTDKPNREFTFIELQIFVSLGVNAIKSKNLLKAVTAGGDQLTFSYQYDGSGNIKEWNAIVLGTSDTAITTTQQIDCD